MAQRLKVLISAYACEPNKGSEPEVGWQWALQMARFHDITVLTRSNNRAAIEAELELLPKHQPVPRFVYHDRRPFMTELKRSLKSVKLYYLLWQKSAWKVVSRLNQECHFELMHHVTFAAFRYPTAVWGHGVPVVWGPVGGIESIPASLLPWGHPMSFAHEVFRNFSNLVQAAPYLVLPRRAEASNVILVSTREMQNRFAQIGFAADLMPTIGLPTKLLPFEPRKPFAGPLRLLFVGNVITLKGLDLALEALKNSGANATFTIVGSGNYLAATKRKARNLGLEDRVNFLGRLPRERTLKLYQDFDLFLFPSLHDTGGYAVIEAMFNELPVICLDCGGPAIAVQENCGVKVPLASRSAVIEGLAQAMRRYDQDRELLREHGRKAREVVLEQYDWEKKAAQMDNYYRRAALKTAARKGQSGMGGTAILLSRVFSLKGMIFACLGLMLIGTLGFLSIGHLKRQAQLIVEDTLPGLSYAGQANASLAQAFNRTLILLLAESSQQKKELAHQIDGFSRETTSFLEAYKNQIYSPEDRRLFQELLRHRMNYLGIRERIVGLAEAGKQEEALALSKKELLPAYQQYKGAGDKLFQYNMSQGTARGQAIMEVCTITQFIVAGIGIFIFVSGFFIGVAR